MRRYGMRSTKKMMFLHLMLKGKSALFVATLILKGQNNYYCSNYKKGCQFSLPFLICGKKLTATQLIMLLRQHRTKTISGFKSKTGKPFSAVLRYDTKTAKLHFEFPNAK